MECWVAPGYGKCARCSAIGLNIKTCKAGGTGIMLAPAGQAFGSKTSAADGDEAVISNGESSRSEEDLDPSRDTKTSLRHAPTITPTTANRSPSFSTMDPSTIQTQGVIDRLLPYYISDRKARHHQVAHKIWQAGALSSDPCAVCEALELDCWVDAKYSRCARCTVSPEYEGMCNAVGTKGAHEGLEKTSSLGTCVEGREHKPAIDDDSSAVELTSVPSRLTKNNQQQPPHNAFSSTANRSLPDYIPWPGAKPTDKAAYNVWVAGKLSSNPCKPCTNSKSECWVNEGYMRCARCTGTSRNAKYCNAAGTLQSDEMVV